MIGYKSAWHSIPPGAGVKQDIILAVGIIISAEGRRIIPRNLREVELNCRAEGKLRIIKKGEKSFDLSCGQFIITM
jgi:hypothetical protein